MLELISVSSVVAMIGIARSGRGMRSRYGGRGSPLARTSGLALRVDQSEDCSAVAAGVLGLLVGRVLAAGAVVGGDDDVAGEGWVAAITGRSWPSRQIPPVNPTTEATKTASQSRPPCRFPRYATGRRAPAREP